MFRMGVSLALALTTLNADVPKPAAEQVEVNTLSKSISLKVLNAIQNAETIPGLEAAEFTALKGEISKTWNTLVEQGSVEVRGTDKDFRPCFVALQAIVEHVLAAELNKEIKTLKAVIHTPMPATPLCSNGEISKELVDPSIEKDPNRLFTVKARTTIVRDYLQQGGDLYIAYPKDGLAKRTDAQQTVYKQELSKHPKHLFDRSLNCAAIPADLIGATYVFTDSSDNAFVFGIKMTQAVDPKDIADFALWFGSIDRVSIKKRIEAVLDFLENNSADPFEITPIK